MAQLVAHPKIDPLQGVNLDQCVIETVDVPIKSCPAKVYNVFKNEPYCLPQFSPNHVASVTLVKGEWGKIGSEKTVIYYPKGKDVSCQTEWFKDKLVCANESAKAVGFQALEGDVLKDYTMFCAGLVVEQLCGGRVARWTIAYKEKLSCIPGANKYLVLLEKVTKEVDEYLSSIN